MLYTKEIEKITFQDVLDFCNQQYRENISLDYKKEIDTSLVKTIAAMANTWGGLIVLGVEDEDSKPKLPLTGIPFREHLREQINNLILGNIVPPIFPEIQASISGDGKSAFVVIRVPQSNMTPHAIKNNTKVYLRTDTSNEPEELAKIDRILWLIEKRNMSVSLKEYFFTRANDRFNNLCKTSGTEIKHTDVFIAMCPIYPFNILVDYNKLQLEIPRRIGVNGWGYSLPRHLGEFKPTQDGAFEYYFNSGSGYIAYEELNHYGFYYYREDLCHTEGGADGAIVHNSLLWDLLTRTDMFCEMMGKYYAALGYWGLLELTISLDKLGEVIFVDLPTPRGFTRFENISSTPIDSKLVFKKEFSFQRLKDERALLVIELIKDICWALGFSHITSETIKLLMKERNRI